MTRSHLTCLTISCLLAASGCAHTEPSTPAAASTPVMASTSTARGSDGSLALTGPDGMPRSFAGVVEPDNVPLTRVDASQGRLVAYFASGAQAFALTLNLGVPFEVRTYDVTTGPVVIELGESFDQRIDVRRARIEVRSVDAAAGAVELAITGETLDDVQGTPASFSFEGRIVAAPADAQP